MTERYVPKWVQTDLDNKQRTIDSQAKRIAELEAAIAGDGKSVFSYREDGQRGYVALPEFVRSMYVKLSNGLEMQITPMNTAGGSVGTKDNVEVMITSWHGMSILPQSGNVVHIGPGKAK